MLKFDEIIIRGESGYKRKQNYMRVIQINSLRYDDREAIFQITCKPLIEPTHSWTFNYSPEFETEELIVTGHGEIVTKLSKQEQETLRLLYA